MALEAMVMVPSVIATAIFHFLLCTATAKNIFELITCVVMYGVLDDQGIFHDQYDNVRLMR